MEVKEENEYEVNGDEDFDDEDDTIEGEIKTN